MNRVTPVFTRVKDLVFIPSLTLFLVAATASAALGQSCDLFPIALSAQTLSNATPNAVLDILNGGKPGSFGWLSWGGSPSEPTLVASLTPPGNSATYVNPDDAGDHQISVGDWVSSKPGVSNSKKVRDALDALMNRDLTVPVWDEARVAGEHAAYRVATFARIRLLSYQLPGQNRITARFLGYTTCGVQNSQPTVNPGVDQAITLPANAFLQGQIEDDGLPNGTLTMRWSKMSGPGTVAFGNPARAATTASFSVSGDYVLRLTADDSAAETSADMTVRVNAAPEATPQTLTTEEDAALSIILSGTDTDGDALTFSIETSPTHGSFIGTLPHLTYVPASNYFGADEFTFTANDGTTNSEPATVSITVLPVNDAPVAFNGSATTDEETPVNVILTGIDVEDSPLTFVIVTPPAHGTLGGSPPNLTYLPGINFAEEDSFTFKASDGVLDSKLATFSLGVNPINDAPHLSVPGQQTVPEDAPLLFDTNRTVSVLDADAGAGVMELSLSVTNGTLWLGSTKGLTFVAGSDGSSSFVTQGSLDSINAALLGLAYVGDTNFSGFDTLVVLVGDRGNTGAGGVFADSISISILVTSVNDAPHLVSTPVTNAQAVPLLSVTGKTYTHTHSYVYDADAVDPEGDPVTYSLVQSPTNMTINATNGLIQWLPNSNHVGTVAVTAKVTDSQGAEGFQNFLIVVPPVVVNMLPFVSAGPDRSFPEYTNSVTLGGVVWDDGVPANQPLAITWTDLTGTGNVSFSNPTSAVTSVSFGAPGLYVLQLSADDTMESASDLVEVRAGILCSIKPSPDMVAWWPGNWTTAELIGGRNVTMAATAGYAAGHVGPAFKFDSSTDFARASAHTNLNLAPGSKGFTLEFWAKPDSLLASGVLGWAGGVRMERNSVGGTGNVLRFFVASSGTTFAQSTSIWPNTNSLVWTHVALTYDRALGQARIYVNGILNATATVGTNLLTTATDFYLGQAPGSPGVFPGQLDEISLYRRPLNPQEVYEVFASGSAGKCPNDNNAAPLVYAGADLFVTGVPGTAALYGEAEDDGLPTGSTLRFQWSKFEGPGTVDFSPSTSLVTSATFSTNGIYVLQLTVDDGQVQRSDLVEVRVEKLCTVEDPQGLAAWWPGNGSAEDVLNGYDAILGNGAGFAPGKVASAFRLDGNDYILVPPQTNYNVGTNSSGFSIEFWAKPDSLLASGVLGWAGGVRAERNSVGGTGNVLRFFVVSSGTTFAQSTSIWPNTNSLVWTHVALTYDRTLGEARIYVNGILNAATTVGTNLLTTATDFYLGQASGSPGVFVGQLDEISLYRRPLGPQEVYETYVSGSTGKCPNDENSPPVVDAGLDASIAAFSDTLQLEGRVTDDGLPTGSILRTWWSRFEGPGTVSFADSNSPSTSVTFSTNGLYILKLSVDDNAILRSDLMEVRVGIPCSVTDPAGLVAAWPGNGSALDLVGRQFGILCNGAGFASGKVASGFRLDGNNYVRMPAQTNYNVGTNSSGFSIEFWAKPDSLLVGGVLGWAGGVRVERNSVGGTGNVLRFFVTSSGTTFAQSTSIWPNTNSLVWTHVALTYDRALGQARIYVNGIFNVATTVGTNLLATASDFYLGQAPGSPGAFPGQLDEIALYSRPLPPLEIQAIYNTGSAGKCITPPNEPPFVVAEGDRVMVLPTTQLISIASNLTVDTHTSTAIDAGNDGFSTLSAPVRPNNGQFQFTISGSTGKTYIIEISSDLTNWTAIDTNVAPSNVFNYTDSSATNLTQFYRIKQGL